MSEDCPHAFKPGEVRTITVTTSTECAFCEHEKTRSERDKALALVDEAIEVARDADRRSDFKMEIAVLVEKRKAIGVAPVAPGTVPLGKAFALPGVSNVELARRIERMESESRSRPLKLESLVGCAAPIPCGQCDSCHADAARDNAAREQPPAFTGTIEQLAAHIGEPDLHGDIIDAESFAKAATELQTEQPAIVGEVHYTNSALVEAVRAGYEQQLAAARWDVDMLVTNHFGERVWLGPCLDAEGKRIGITECCGEESPCEHHAEIAAQRRRS